MPNRIIREACRTSLSLSKLSHGAERMFWRLLTCADDFGRVQADPELIQAACFPRQLLSVHVADVRAYREELIVHNMLVLYTHSGNEYAYFKNWDKWNKKRSKYAKYPAPPASASTCEQMPTYADICASNREARVEIRDTRVEKREGLAHANGHEPTPADLERGLAYLRAAGLNPPHAD
jgi:hypothetical protein